MAIDPKSLTIDYRTLLKNTSISDRVQLTKSQSGQQLLSTLTPSQIGDMFPDYYKRSNPDVSGFIEATARRYRKKATGSELAPGQEYNEEAGGRGRTGKSELGGTGAAGREKGRTETEEPWHQRMSREANTTTGYSSALSKQREKFAEELKDPSIKQRLFDIAHNEQGMNPDGVLAVMESAMNRAYVQGTSLKQQLGWASQGGYYDDRQRKARGQEVDGQADVRNSIYQFSMEEALRGSNRSNHATDNASGAFAEGRANKGEYVVQYKAGGETFFSPGSKGNFSRQRWEQWRDASVQEDAKLAQTDSNKTANISTTLPEGLNPQVMTRYNGLDETGKKQFIREVNTWISSGRGSVDKLNQWAASDAEKETKRNLAAYGAKGKDQYTETHANSLDYLYNRGGHSSRMEDGKIVHTHPSDYGVDPEFAARLSAAGKAYEAETGDKAKYGELGRGEDVQSIYYSKYLKGGPLAAAPGGSRHQHGDAGDLPDSPFRKWLYSGNAQKYGLRFPHSNDAPHVQKDPGYKGANYYTPEQKTAKTDESVKQPNNLIPPAQVTEKQGPADKGAPKPSSYIIDYNKAIPAIKQQNPGAALLGDEGIKDRINSELDKRGIKVDKDGKIIVTKEQMDSVSKETNLDVSQYMTPDAAALGDELTVNDPSNITATPISDRRDTGGRENMRLYAEGKTVDVNVNEGMSYNQDTNKLKITPEFRNRPEQLAEQRRTQNRQEDRQQQVGQRAQQKPLLENKALERTNAWDSKFAPISHYTTDAFERMVGVNEKFGFGAHFGYGNPNA